MREYIIELANIHYVVYLLVVMGLVVVSVGVDLLTGLEKAHANHEPVRSSGLRRTLKKLLEYWGLTLMCFTVDILLLITPISEPYVTMTCGFAIILVEVKSVVENLRAKQSKAAEVADLVQKIIAASDNEQARKILAIIKEEQDNGKKED